jgi:hypothetical protein
MSCVAKVIALMPSIIDELLDIGNAGGGAAPSVPYIRRDRAGFRSSRAP